MTFAFRVTCPALAALLAVSIIACRPAVGDNSPAAVPVASVSSLSNRPMISIVFTHPSMTIGQTAYRRPLMDHLTAHTPYVARALFHTTPERTIGMLEQRLGELAYLDVVDYIEAHDQLGATPLVKPLNQDGEPVSYSVFLTKQDSPLRSLADLKGHSLALGSYHSTLSRLIPRHELLQAGIELDEIGAIEYLDSDEAIASAVLQGAVDAGAVDDLAARRYQDKGLRVLHVSSPIPSAPLVIRAEMPERVSGAIRDALLLLDFDGAKDREDWDEDLRYGFVPASQADYEPVRHIMETSGKGCQLSCHAAE